jgi:hypothetical protein
MNGITNKDDISLSFNDTKGVSNRDDISYSINKMNGILYGQFSDLVTIQPKENI